MIGDVATLGILLMNAVAFALPDAAYLNLEQAGNDTALDTAIGVAGRILVDQKMMALFLLLFGIGLVVVNTSAVLWLMVNPSIEDVNLGGIWFIGGELSDGVDGLFLLDGFGRAHGLMLIGVGLFRLGFVQGDASQATYRRVAVWGLGSGVPLLVAGLLINTSTDWAGSSAFSGHAISTFGTVPMALTNYLTQTIIGVAVFRLVRFRFGPVEGAWRSATYRSLQPLRR